LPWRAAIPSRVRDPREGFPDRLQLLRVALEAFQVFRAAVQRPLDERRHEVLGKLAETLELEEGDLRLDHPELGQVAPRFRLLRAEGRPEAVHLAERRGRGLQVQLPRLREIGLVPEVVRLEERRGPLDRGARQDRRVDPHVLALVKEVRDRLLHLRTDPQHRVLLRGAHPEVPEVHQEVDPVLLGRDRVLRRFAQDADRDAAHLEAARRAFFLANGARHLQRALLRRLLGRLPDLRRDLGLEPRLT
jgi:hypothetical protein